MEFLAKLHSAACRSFRSIFIPTYNKPFWRILGAAALRSNVQINVITVGIQAYSYYIHILSLLLTRYQV